MNDFFTYNFRTRMYLDAKGLKRLPISLAASLILAKIIALERGRNIKCWN